MGIMEDFLQTNRSSAHLDACNQACTCMWYKELQTTLPKRWEMMVSQGRVRMPMYAPAPPGAGDPFVRGTKSVESWFAGTYTASQVVGEPWPEEVVNAASDPRNLTEARVYRKTMEYTFRLLDEECGGIPSYLASIGFGPKDIAKLRDIFVEEASA